MVIAQLEDTVGIDCFLEICKELAERTGVQLKTDRNLGYEEEYLLQKQREENHEYGSGGYYRSKGIILLGSKKIIESEVYVSWSTTSDDSMDYPAANHHDLILYVEDSFGRSIFDKIKQMVEKKEGKNGR